MALFIIGHGVQEAGDSSRGLPARTVVPTNGEVTFFSDSGRNLAMVNGLAALEANSRANGYHYPGGSNIENYRLSPLADDERQLFETVQANSDTLAGALYVGVGNLPAGIRLCYSTACQGGVHKCGGVFQLCPGPIIVLACRGDGSGSSTAQQAFGTTNNQVLLEKYDNDFRALAAMTRFAAGQWLYQLASYNKEDPSADAQLEAAYLLSNEYFSSVLADYNVFREYFVELDAGDATHVPEYVKLYEALDASDVANVELWGTTRVNTTIQAAQPTSLSDVSDEDLLRNLNDGTL
jgi:hypothetical protein